MRKSVPVLFGLAGFLIAAGLVALIWAPGVVKRTPIENDATTRLTGEAAKLDTATGELVPNKVKATSITKSDTKISDDNVVAFTNSSCLLVDTDDAPDCVDGKDKRLISASTDVFATDRKTALAVNSGKYLPDDAVDHDGLINKWPFDAEKKTYPYWDGTAGKAVDAVYDRTEKVDGLETYVYKVAVQKVPIDVAKGVKGTYDDLKEIYIEPKTGKIIHQTDDQVKKNVDDAQDSIGSLKLVTTTIPLVGLIGGGLCLVGGIVLLLASGKGTRAAR